MTNISSSCDAAAVQAERIAGFGLDTKPTSGSSLAVYDRAFLRGGDPHDAEDERPRWMKISAKLHASSSSVTMSRISARMRRRRSRKK